MKRVLGNIVEEFNSLNINLDTKRSYRLEASGIIKNNFVTKVLNVNLGTFLVMRWNKIMKSYLNITGRDSGFTGSVSPKSFSEYLVAKSGLPEACGGSMTISFNNRNSKVYYNSNSKYSRLEVQLTDINKVLEKHGLFFLSVTFLSMNSSFGHENSLLFYKKGDDIEIFPYEPHGSKETAVIHKISDPFFKIIKNKLGKNVILKSREDSCPIGLQDYTEDKSGFCVMFSLLWLYSLMRCFKEIKNFSTNDIANIEKFYIYASSEKYPSKRIDCLRTFVAKFGTFMIDEYIKKYNLSEYIDRMIEKEVLERGKKVPNRKYVGLRCNHDYECSSDICFHCKTEPCKDYMKMIYGDYKGEGGICVEPSMIDEDVIYESQLESEVEEYLAELCKKAHLDFENVHKCVIKLATKKKMSLKSFVDKYFVGSSQYDIHKYDKRKYDLRFSGVFHEKPEAIFSHTKTGPRQIDHIFNICSIFILFGKI
jgi:hypothetical protein